MAVVATLDSQDNLQQRSGVLTTVQQNRCKKVVREFLASFPTNGHEMAHKKKTNENKAGYVQNYSNHEDGKTQEPKNSALHQVKERKNKKSPRKQPPTISVEKKFSTVKIANARNHSFEPETPNIMFPLTPGLVNPKKRFGRQACNQKMVQKTSFPLLDDTPKEALFSTSFMKENSIGESPIRREE